MSDAAEPSTSQDKPIQVKLVLLGEAAVGKSSIVMRFVNNEFQGNKEPTIGAAFLTQRCRIDDRVLRYEIWDTAGQERFHSLAPMYYRNAQAAVVVYDITKASSLDKAKSWVKELQRQANPNIVIALAGNKLDLVKPEETVGLGSVDSSTVNDSDSEPASPHETVGDDEADDATATPGENPTSPAGFSLREVPKEEAQAYATEAGLLFFETSAKTGDGIMEVFTEIAKQIPIEHLLSSNARTAGGRNAAGGRTADAAVKLDADASKTKDACAC